MPEGDRVMGQDAQEKAVTDAVAGLVAAGDSAALGQVLLSVLRYLGGWEDGLTGSDQRAALDVVRATRQELVRAVPQSRPFDVIAVLVRKHGGTVKHVRCPFCADEIQVRQASLSGAGKRCSCGALFKGSRCTAEPGAV